MYIYSAPYIYIYIYISPLDITPIRAGMELPPIYYISIFDIPPALVYRPQKPVPCLAVYRGCTVYVVTCPYKR